MQLKRKLELLFCINLLHEKGRGHHATGAMLPQVFIVGRARIYDHLKQLVTEELLSAESVKNEGTRDVTCYSLTVWGEELLKWNRHSYEHLTEEGMRNGSDFLRRRGLSL